MRFKRLIILLAVVMALLAVGTATLWWAQGQGAVGPIDFTAMLREMEADLARRQATAALFQKRVHDDGRGHALAYRLLIPRDYDPQRSYPLVLYLHGRVECGSDNETPLLEGGREGATMWTSDEHRSEHPCFVMVPQCPDGQRWVEYDSGSPALAQALEPAVPMRLVMEALSSLQREFSIDPGRLYVIGCSMGGFGAWDLITRRPELFAAAVPICGGGDEAKAPLLKEVPIWAFHGALDGSVPVERSRRMIEAIRRAGGAPRYTEYPNEAHGSWEPAYREEGLARWLFAQSRGREREQGEAPAQK